MQIPRNKLDSLIKELKEVTGMEFFLFDPNSMTQAELKEQEERVKEHQEKIKMQELGIESRFECTECGNEMKFGYSFCTNCGKEY